MEHSAVTDTTRLWADDLPAQQLLAQLLGDADKFSHVRTGGAQSPAELADVLGVLEDGGGKIRSEASSCGHEARLFDMKGGVLFLAHSPRWNEWSWVVASHLRSNVDRWAAGLNTMLPPFTQEAGQLYCTFWARNPMGGGYSYVRPLECSPWTEVAVNYPEAVRTELTRLMARKDPGTGGKLVLFHGPPGTGKTRSILALLKEWGDWCEPHVITDPEAFFNHIDYLNDVILQGGSSEKWRLLVVEDGDEFMDTDAKARTGQALARLLNLADGLVGQGLKVLTLITTNVPMESLNGAVARTGRCLLNLEFPAFDTEGAQAWLESNGVSAEAPDEGATLADLYGMARRATHLAGELGRFD